MLQEGIWHVIYLGYIKYVSHSTFKIIVKTCTYNLDTLIFYVWLDLVKKNGKLYLHMTSWKEIFNSFFKNVVLLVHEFIITSTTGLIKLRHFVHGLFWHMFPHLFGKVFVAVTQSPLTGCPSIRLSLLGICRESNGIVTGAAGDWDVTTATPPVPWPSSWVLSRLSSHS